MPKLDRGAVLVEAGRLAAEGRAFVLATVCAVRRPASARIGDRGIVTADGKLVGWVGGACSEPAVVREALRALAEGTTRLLRICPPGSSVGEEGVVVAESSCTSEGTVEVLIEPQLPQPLLAVVGESPAAVTLRELAVAVGWRVTSDLGAGAEAVVVATMGRGDPVALDAALATPAGYVGLVASAKRAQVELGALRERGLDEETLARVRSPAGLDLGPLTQPEIAVAVLAELVAWRHARGPLGGQPVEALDPVCGMTVAVTAGTPSVEHAGTTYWFCCPGCATTFAGDPARFLASA
ncbi:MAG TPA: XdhC family protein [Gaiella sp.]|nr:XdhC family protein [Gaiella sp.]